MSSRYTRRESVESVAKSLSYWSTANGDDTMITLWNPADEAQDLVFTLFFSGGHYNFPVHLGPRATGAFNISEIIHNQIPDDEGNVIPASVREGSAEIRGPKGENQHILVSMDGGTYNVQKATCGNYCFTCQGAVEFFVTANPFAVAVSGQTQLTFTTQYHSGTQYNLTATSTWSSSNTGIGTVNAGLVTGVGPGSLQINVFDDSTPDYFHGCVAGEPDMYCPWETGGGGGSPGTVTQCPNSVSLANTTNIPLEDDFPTYKTGIGIVASMQVSGPSSNSYNGSKISESLSVNGVMQDTCPANYFSECNGSATFTVGTGGTDYGVLFNPANNIFYDDHSLVYATSLLDAAGLNTCTYSCNQTYSAVSDPAGNSCGGTSLGSFLITYTFTKDTINGTPVTRTGVTEH